MAEGEAPRHTPPAPIKDDEVREFMTDWFGPGFEPMPMLAWSVRKRASLMGSGKSKRFLPTFRPFDLLSEPNASQLVFENECQRIGVESLCGVQPAFSRYLDFNALYFQFAGKSTVETECGVYETAPGDLLLVPEGVAHRSHRHGGCAALVFSSARAGAGDDGRDERGQPHRIHRHAQRRPGVEDPRRAPRRAQGPRARTHGAMARSLSRRCDRGRARLWQHRRRDQQATRQSGEPRQEAQGVRLLHRDHRPARPGPEADRQR